MSFNIALSGLNAAQAQLDVTSNNIANVETTGFKQSRTMFGDIYANSTFGNSDTAIGNGVLLQDVTQQSGVLVGQAFTGINQQHHNMRQFNRLQRLDGAEFFHRFGNTRPTPDPGSVNQFILLAIPLGKDADGIAGGAGLVKGQHTIFPEDAVNQRRFAHVGPADDGQPQQVFVHSFRLFSVLCRWHDASWRRSASATASSTWSSSTTRPAAAST